MIFTSVRTHTSLKWFETLSKIDQWIYCFVFWYHVCSHQTWLIQQSIVLCFHMWRSKIAFIKLRIEHDHSTNRTIRCLRSTYNVWRYENLNQNVTASFASFYHNEEVRIEAYAYFVIYYDATLLLTHCIIWIITLTCGLRLNKKSYLNWKNC